jgi:hypothetical protein
MNNELQRACKEAVVTHFKELSKHVAEGTEKNDQKPQNSQPMQQDSTINLQNT